MPGASFTDFVALIETLRGPGGCPWDAKQTHESIAPNMTEEAYEAVYAIETHDTAALREELGDVLLQVVLQSVIARDAAEFTIDDVIADVHAKMVRRHPHVFGDVVVENDRAYRELWARIKREEKAAEAETQEPVGLFDDLAFSMPALKLAADISKKAVAAGFEWDTVDQVVDKLSEETDELLAEQPATPEAADEVGDMLFTVVNIARKYHVDPEAALRRTCHKFCERWRYMEHRAAAEGRTIEEYPLEEQERFWQEAKTAHDPQGEAS